MKAKFNLLWAAALAAALFTVANVGAQQRIEPKYDAADYQAPKNWWTDFSISPYGAVSHPDFGKPVWGAGLDLGYAINRVVSLHVASTVFDYDHAGWFDHSTLDETELLFRADLIKTGGAGKDRFVAFLLGSGGRNWETEDWSFGAGVGAELRLSRNFSLGVDSRIRAWMKENKDLMTRGFLSVKF